MKSKRDCFGQCPRNDESTTPSLRVSVANEAIYDSPHLVIARLCVSKIVAIYIGFFGLLLAMPSQ